MDSVVIPIVTLNLIGIFGIAAVALGTSAPRGMKRYVDVESEDREIGSMSTTYNRKGRDDETDDQTKGTRDEGTGDEGTGDEGTRDEGTGDNGTGNENGDKGLRND